MRNNRPQTAKEAQQAIERIVRDLPEKEQERLLSFGHSAWLEPIVSEVRKLWPSMTVALTKRELWSVIRKVLRQLQLPKNARRRILYFLANQNDVVYEYVLMKRTVAVAVCENIRDSLKSQHDIARELAGKVVELLSKQAAPSNKRRETTRKRIQEMDALLDENYLKSEIYERMRERHPKLIPGRGKEFMDEDEMWRSYYDNGGKRQRNCNNAAPPGKN